MTTELMALADRVAHADAIEIVDGDLIDRNFSMDERDMIVASIRLAATQAGAEVGVEELADWLDHCEALRIAYVPTREADDRISRHRLSVSNHK